MAENLRRRRVPRRRDAWRRGTCHQAPVRARARARARVRVRVRVKVKVRVRVRVRVGARARAMIRVRVRVRGMRGGVSHVTTQSRAAVKP